MLNLQNPNVQNKKYDLEDRTEKFATDLIRFTKNIRIIFQNKNIIEQLLRSGTSVGSNYREANGAESKKDFCHKIAICKKESKETQYWLKLLLISNPEEKDAINILLNEIHELIMIFAKIYISSRKIEHLKI